MKKEVLLIDGQNIFDTWTLKPMYEKFYSDMMKFPDIKSRPQSDYEDEDGLNVLYTTGRLKDKEVTVSFFVDSYDYYLLFMNYLLANPVFYLSSLIIDKIIPLEYLSHSDFHYYPNTGDCTFGIKVREANFKNRADIYLLTDNGNKVITDNDVYIIL